jgi:hypothetical protein
MFKEKSETLTTETGFRKLGKWAINAYANNSIKSMKTAGSLLGVGGFIKRL